VQAGVTPPTFEPVASPTRYDFADGRTLALSTHLPTVEAQLTTKERQAYEALLNDARSLYDAAAPVFVDGPPPSLWDLTRYGLRHGLAARPWLNLPAYVGRRQPSGALRDVFLRFATYFGADPFRAPAVLHNIAWVELGLGAVNPKGGVAGLVEAYETLLHRVGVNVERHAEVRRIAPHGNGVEVTVTTGSGSTRQVKADGAISALDVARTYRLMGRSHPSQRWTPSLSGFVLALAVQGESDLRMQHNLVMPSVYEKEFEELAKGRHPSDPTLYVSISSKVDRDHAPTGWENWFVLVNAPPGVRTDKAAYSRHLLGLLERRGWLAAGEATVLGVFDTDHLERFASHGSIYGRMADSLRATIRHGHDVTGMPNLKLAGGTVHPGGGVPLAVRSGLQSARALHARF
jgi:phytoene dehydrogenase-like protein